MKDRIEYILFISLSVIIRILGLRLSRKLSFILTAFFYYILPIRKSTVIENLSRAFPDYSAEKIKEITYGTYRSFVITFIEILYSPSVSKSKMEQFLISPSNDLILNKYKYKKGLILVAAHFANWEYMAMSVSLQVKVPFAIPVKKQSNILVSDWLDKMRTRFGNKVVPLGISIRDIYSELKNGNIVAMLADQRGPADGLRMDFLGKETSVYSGPAILSLKTGAPMLFGIPVRQNDFSYIVYIEEISMNDLPEDKDGQVRVLTERYIRLLEKYIKAYPEQWFWMHKRWKY